MDAFKNIPLQNKWIYQSNIPVPPLEKVKDQVAAVAGKPSSPYVFRAEDFKPLVETKSGSVRLADSTNFLVSKTIAATVVTIKPGGLRDMHWHPNADEWNYWIKGALAELRATLKLVDVLLINDTETKMLAGETNLPRAARSARSSCAARVSSLATGITPTPRWRP